jgi:hypothetical protein
LTNETISDVLLRAQSSVCVTFRTEVAGPAYAGVLGFRPIELGTGTCDSPGGVLARATTGEVALLLGVGDHYVRIEHAGNVDTTVRFTLRYLILV